MNDRTSDSEQSSITEARRTAARREKFQKEQGAFRAAFEHAAIGMALVDLDGRFLKVNRSLCQIVGYSEKELLAINPQTIIHPDDLEVNRALGVQLRFGEIDHYHMEGRFRHKLGHSVWVQMSASIERDGAGKPCYFIAHTQDITARKNAEQESTRRMRCWERLTHAVSQILHTLESMPDDAMYSAVLRIALDSFQSKTGWFLRFSCDEVLVGPCLSSTATEVRGLREHWCELWHKALSERAIVAENHHRSMSCGKLLSRSLVAPVVHHKVPLGLFHIADRETDYDADDCDLLSHIADMIAPRLNARLGRQKLTRREAEVMDLIVSGKTQKQIASDLGISIQTTAKHRAKVLAKLKVGNDVELVRLALQM
ncbi:MAG: PAS domain S-box protein [Pirellulales bacterium]